MLSSECCSSAAFARLEFGGRVDVFVHGDTHVEGVEEVRGVLLVNPGSPTFPRNLTRRPGTLGFLEIADGAARAWIQQLEAER